MLSWWLEKSEEDVGLLEQKSSVAVSRHVGAGKNPGPMQNQHVLLTAEPSLQTHFICLILRQGLIL